MNENLLIEEFSNAVIELKRTHDDKTFYWILDTDKKGNDWAIVIGWSDGFEEVDGDKYSFGSYRLCAKLAYQPPHSIMQCDYDIDWYMPHNENTNEVDDTNVTFYSDNDIRENIDYLIKMYKEYEYSGTFY